MATCGNLLLPSVALWGCTGKGVPGSKRQPLTVYREGVPGPTQVTVYRRMYRSIECPNYAPCGVTEVNGCTGGVPGYKILADRIWSDLQPSGDSRK